MAWTRTITSAGEALIASAFGATLNYTTVKAGAGSVPVADLNLQTDVTDFFKDLSIVSVSAKGSQSVLSARLNNVGITAETPLTQLGIFASINNEPEVLLVILQNDTPSMIPPWDAQPGYVFEPQFNIAISGVANFTAIIDWNAYAKISDIQNITQGMENQISDIQARLSKAEAHATQTVASENGVHGLRYWGDPPTWQVMGENGEWEEITPPAPAGSFSIMGGVLSHDNTFGTITPNEKANTLTFDPALATISGQTVNLL